MTDQPRDPYRGDGTPPADGTPTYGTSGASASGSGIPQAPAYGSDQGHSTPTYGGSNGGPGQVPPPPPAGGAYPPAQPKGSNGLAIGALVCGILAIPAACCGGWPGILLGIVAIVLAVLARKKAARGEAPRSGLATAGMITGIIGLLMGLALFALIAALGPKADACKGKESDPNAYQKCIMDQLGVDSSKATTP